MVPAHFRFHGSLNDFLSSRRKGAWLAHSCSYIPSVKDAIEALGVPHPEVGRILRNGQPVNFFQPLHPGDSVEVYPVSDEAKAEAYRLRPPLPHPARFILDVHLGSLARSLRLLGFDTLYRNDFEDARIARLAAEEHRIVLTRDIGLLKHKLIHWGYWLRSQQTDEQATEVLRHFRLYDEAHPFTRCIACNGLIEKVARGTILHLLPEATAGFFDDFYQCTACRKVYWKGSHYDRMLQSLERLKKRES